MENQIYSNSNLLAQINTVERMETQDLLKSSIVVALAGRGCTAFHKDEQIENILHILPENRQNNSFLCIHVHDRVHQRSPEYPDRHICLTSLSSNYERSLSNL